MGDMPDIRDDLPMSMTMSAFIGISWYIGAEINTSLFLLFKRRRGLYFWACALCSWGVVLQPLFIILADFNVWTNLRGSITMIYLSWAIMVVPQSWVLYSRLHLIMHEEAALRWIKFALIFTSIVFSVPTIIIGLLAVSMTISVPMRRQNLDSCCFYSFLFLKVAVGIKSIDCCADIYVQPHSRLPLVARLLF